MSMPVQNLLFQNLAPQPHVPEPLAVEFLSRHSFDNEDKMMEMTPQGYNN